VDPTGHRLGERLACVFAVKGGVSDQEDEQDHPSREYVSSRGDLVLRDHLGRDVPHCTCTVGRAI
jgi:hypothetical protein